MLFNKITIFSILHNISFSISILSLEKKKKNNNKISCQEIKDYFFMKMINVKKSEEVGKIYNKNYYLLLKSNKNVFYNHFTILPFYHFAFAKIIINYVSINFLH